MVKGLVSIISVFYNRMDLVEETIRCLVGQTYSELQIILVDDGSKDETGAYLKKWAKSDDRITAIIQKNKGFTQTMIDVIRDESKGEFIAVHGSGDFSFPDRIKRQVELMDSEPEIGFVNVNEQIVFPKTGKETIVRRSAEYFHDRMKKTCVCCHGNMMYRRVVYDQCGGYRRFFLFAQDYDLWLRMSSYANYGVVNEVLYRQVRLEDGVGECSSRRITQLYLGDMARQMALFRSKYGEPDVVDQDGIGAAFSRQKSAHLAREFCSEAKAQVLNNGNKRRAMLAYKLSLREGVILDQIAVVGLIVTPVRVLNWLRSIRQSRRKSSRL